jgi:hypothetical protein
MSNGATPIDPSEPILRRIVKGPGYYDLLKAPPLERGAFTPNRRDDDGLSFYLERELSIAQLISAATRPPEDLVVVRLTARDIYDLELTLIRVMREGDLPGHVVIPELNYYNYNDQRFRQRIKDAGESLVRLGLTRIVFGA